MDYLLKPIDDEELESALQKFRKIHAQQNEAFDVQHLKSFLNLNPSEYKKRFTIQVGQHLKLINVDEISCFYSENKGTYLHSIEGRSYLMDYSLDKLEPELGPKIFYRVNRQFIIKLCDIVDIITYSNQRLEVKLKNFKEQQIIVSRERVKGFREWLQ